MSTHLPNKQGLFWHKLIFVWHWGPVHSGKQSHLYDVKRFVHRPLKHGKDRQCCKKKKINKIVSWTRHKK
jgi:hypothetical protein